MIKTFCDGCGKEIDATYQASESAFVFFPPPWYEVKSSITEFKFAFCETCFIKFAKSVEEAKAEREKKDG